jgi:hypothetical protein
MKQYCAVAMTFELAFDGAGWLHATVKSDAQSWTAQASYLSEAPEDLLDAVLALCCGASTAEAVWWEEPQYARWVLQRHEDAVTVLVAVDDTGTTGGSVVFEAVTDMATFGRLILDGVSAAVDGMSDAEYRKLWKATGDRHDIVTRLEELRFALDGELSDRTRSRLVQDRRVGFGSYSSSLG